MGRGLFREGGPHQIERFSDDEYRMSVTIPKDVDGRVARECPNAECSPGYFKVMPGTGIVGTQEVVYCPYCRREGAPANFHTDEQTRYAKDLLLREAMKGVHELLGDALNLGPTGKRKIGGGLISIEMSLEPSSLPEVRRPFEDEVRRDVVCPGCGLDQTVFGLASWCADCGQDIFMTHVAAELAVTRVMLGDVGRREELLGKRVAVKDLENCLEDAVSIFEAAARAIVRRRFLEQHKPKDEIEKAFKRIGNAFQSIDRTRQHLSELFGITFEDESVWDQMGHAFEKRHPITHNLGVIDRKYLQRVQAEEREGREVRITAAEIEVLLGNVEQAVARIHTSVLSASELDPTSPSSIA